MDHLFDHSMRTSVLPDDGLPADWLETSCFERQPNVNEYQPMHSPRRDLKLNTSEDFMSQFVAAQVKRPGFPAPTKISPTKSQPEGHYSPGGSIGVDQTLPLETPVDVAFSTQSFALGAGQMSNLTSPLTPAHNAMFHDMHMAQHSMSNISPVQESTVANTFTDFPTYGLDVANQPPTGNWRLAAQSAVEPMQHNQVDTGFGEFDFTQQAPGYGGELTAASSGHTSPTDASWPQQSMTSAAAATDSTTYTSAAWNDPFVNSYNVQAGATPVPIMVPGFNADSYSASAGPSALSPDLLPIVSHATLQANSQPMELAAEMNGDRLSEWNGYMSQASTARAQPGMQQQTSRGSVPIKHWENLCKIRGCEELRFDSHKVALQHERDQHGELLQQDREKAEKERQRKVSFTLLGPHRGGNKVSKKGKGKEQQKKPARILRIVTRCLVDGCGKESLNDNDAKRHFYTPHWSRLKKGPGGTKLCHVQGCDAKFTELKECQKHFNEHHFVGDLLRCSFPGCTRENEFRRRDHLRDHVRRVHAELPQDGSTIGGVEADPQMEW